MSAKPSQLEKLVEARIAAAVAIRVTDRQISAFRTPAPEGQVKETNHSCVEIRVLPRAGESFESDAVTLHAVVSITAAQSDDPTGASLQAAFEAVMDVFDGWDSDDDAAAASLDIASLFECHAVMLAPGGDNGFDDTLKVWYEVIMLDITGRILRTP